MATGSEDLIKRLDSLTDPTRIRLLRLLERQELGVMELCQILLLPQSTVSRHLKILTERGWLRIRQQGAVNLYGLSESAGTEDFSTLWFPVREQCETWPAIRQDHERLNHLMEKRRKAADLFFRKAAAGWDQLRDEMYGKELTFQVLLSLLPSHWVVADLGCGTGQVSLALAPCVKRVIAVDQSPEMLSKAQSAIGEAGNVEVRAGDLENVPIQDGECHAALLLLVLSYVERPEQVIREASRILRPGGRLVVVDLCDHLREDFQQRMGQLWLGFEKKILGRYFRDNGFRSHKISVLPTNDSAKGPPLFLACAEKAGNAR